MAKEEDPWTVPT